MKESREQHESIEVDLTCVWAADEGAQDEHRVQGHETKPAVWHLLTHFLELAQRDRVRLCACGASLK